MNDKPETSVSEQHTDETTTDKTNGGSVTFSPEQQKLVNKLFDKATARQARKHREELAKVQAERDAAAGGTLEESELVTKLRAERDTAQSRIREMERAKSEAIAASAFTKAWKAAGLEDNDQWRANMRAIFTRINDDGESVVVDLQGRERYGIDLATLMGELAGEFPKLRPGAEGNSGNPSGSHSNGNTRVTAKDDLKTTRGKMDYITKFGLPAWEALPSTNETRNAGGATREAGLARNWSNEKKALYIKEHGAFALSQLMARERDQKR